MQQVKIGRRVWNVAQRRTPDDLRRDHMPELAAHLERNGWAAMLDLAGIRHGAALAYENRHGWLEIVGKA